MISDSPDSAGSRTGSAVIGEFPQFSRGGVPTLSAYATKKYRSFVGAQKGSTGRDNRMFVEGVLWIVRTGSPWRDLPEVFGEWNSVFRRFSRWSDKGVWRRIFEAMSDDPDFEYLIVDSTIIRAHQHAAGAKKGGLKIRPLVAPAAA